MRKDKPLKADPLHLLLQSEQELNASDVADSYGFYELLHRIAGRIAPTDAFYVCLYSEADRTLLFAYNFDSGIYDEPVTVPLGKGPTSWVVRHGQPFILGPENKATHSANISFGDMERKSRSAAHLPMRAPVAGNPQRLLGVLSAQSYTANAYDAPAAELLQWLADQAGRKLQQERDAATVRHIINEAEARAEARQRHVTGMAEEFGQMLKSLNRQIATLRPLLPPGDKQLRQAIESLCRECQRHQTVANQLPLRPCYAPDAGQAMPSPAPATLTLSRGEREVLELLRQGLSNGAIAHQLGISHDAVKFRLKGLYRKLDVDNRLQAVQVAASLIPAPAKTTQEGR